LSFWAEVPESLYLSLLLNPLTLSRKHVAVLLAALAGLAAAVCSIRAQSQGQPSQPHAPTSPPPARNLIVVDPAHGGPDLGATLSDRVFEKDVTLAFAARLRATLTAAGFTVVATRDADPADPLSSDARAELANRTHAVACLVLHATSTGSGVHIYTSTLPPPLDINTGDQPAFVPTPWDSAQEAYVRQSRILAGTLSAALAAGSLPAITGQAPLRPLDNLTCPAVAIELAPLLPEATPATDAGYQQRVAGALTGALRTWRDQARQGAQ
jgi:N-acetylmuramoyl-L-alanine amidase